MSLTRYEPFNMLQQFQKEMNRLFDNKLELFNTQSGELMNSQWTPAVDVHEEANALVVTADVPGVEPNKIEVTTANGVLTLKGERNTEKETKEKDYRRVERSYGRFFRAFSLPDNVDVEHITAKTRDGVLEIRIPKTEKSPVKRIAVEG